MTPEMKGTVTMMAMILVMVVVVQSCENEVEVGIDMILTVMSALVLLNTDMMMVMARMTMAHDDSCWTGGWCGRWSCPDGAGCGDDGKARIR